MTKLPELTPEQVDRIRAWLEYMRTVGVRNKDEIKTLACRFAINALLHGPTISQIKAAKKGVPKNPELTERCPTCAEPVASIFDHVDRDCEHE